MVEKFLCESCIPVTSQSQINTMLHGVLWGDREHVSSFDVSILTTNMKSEYYNSTSIDFTWIIFAVFTNANTTTRFFPTLLYKEKTS